jgi:hypothetical protein
MHIFGQHNMVKHAAHRFSLTGVCVTVSAAVDSLSCKEGCWRQDVHVGQGAGLRLIDLINLCTLAVLARIEQHGEGVLGFAELV